MDPDSKRILVALRIRPQNEAEKFDVTAVRKVDFKSVMVIAEELHTSNSDSPCIGFNFDAVFDDADDQRAVYEDGCLGMIDAALDGHFVTILAYGQTGSGKTHTILGAPANANGELQEQTGMFLRVFNDLFAYQANMRSRMHVLIALSAVELYVDDIFDLLGEKAKVRLREVGNDAVLSGTKYIEVTSLHEVIRYFAIANAARSVTATKMNAASSRSHALFFIDVFQIPLSQNPSATSLKIDDVISSEGDIKPIKNMVHSRVSLVDLAGSERTKKSGVEGQGLVEANAINKSLSTLGNVINALYTRKGHIPFRDHRLTSILKPAFLDENSRVLLVGQVSPASSNAPESLMTLKFCDRLKNLKADGVVLTENPELLQALATASRTAGELAADVQISREKALCGLGRARFWSQRSGAAHKECVANATAKLQAESQKALNKIAREDAEALEVRRDAETKKRIAVALADRSAMEAKLRPLEAEVESMKAAFERLILSFTEATDQKMTQAKKAKKARVQLEEKLKELAPENEKLDTALEYTTARLLAIEHMKNQPKPASHEKDADWIAQEEEWAQQEGNHGIVQDFYRLWQPLGAAHEAFIETVRESALATAAAKKAKSSGSKAAPATTASVLGNLVPDIVHYCIDHAVDVSLGVVDPHDRFEWFYVYGSSTKLKDWHFWPNPINTTPNPKFPPPSGIPAAHDISTFSDDESLELVQQRQTTPTASPVSTETPTLEITHAQAVKNAREKRKQNRTAGANNVGKRFETEEANKHYLMTVYDSPTLVQDVSRFLGAGTVMEKHGRNGAPHKKKVFIAITGGQREVVWIDPPEAGAAANGARSSIPISTLSKIVLGAYSKVFKRYQTTPNDAAFYFSFSLHTKDKSRTLDLVADTLVDFEAWVLGLSHMVQVDPVWGGSLSIPKEAILSLSLTPKEVSLCEKENILPHVYAAIRKVITDHRDEVAHQMQIFDNDPVQAYESMGGIHAPQMNHKGAVLMTKGELRFHTKNWNVDIFRVCKLWQLFRDMDLIYDPSYLPATCFGTTVRF